MSTHGDDSEQSTRRHLPDAAKSGLDENQDVSQDKKTSEPVRLDHDGGSHRRDGSLFHPMRTAGSDEITEATVGGPRAGRATVSENHDDFVRGLRELIREANRRTDQPPIDGDEKTWRDRLAATLDEHRDSLERRLVMGTRPRLTSDAWALVHAYFDLTEASGTGGTTAALRDDELFLTTRNQPPEQSRVSSAIDELVVALETDSSRHDEALLAHAILRRIRNDYGVRGFFTRAERTSRIALWLTSFFPSLLALAGLRAATAPPLTSSSGSASEPVLSDLCLLVLAQSQALSATNVQVRRQAVAATDRVDQLVDALRGAEKEELRARRRAVAVRESLALVRRKVVAAEEGLESVRDENAELAHELTQMANANERLKATIERERSSAQRAIDEAVACERARGDALNDSQLELLYRNTWRLGRVVGSPDDWYAFLRAAATGAEGDVSPHQVIHMGIQKHDPRERTYPESMETLASYRPLPVVAPSAPVKPNRSALRMRVTRTPPSQPASPILSPARHASPVTSPTPTKPTTVDLTAPEIDAGRARGRDETSPPSMESKRMRLDNRETVTGPRSAKSRATDAMVARQLQSELDAGNGDETRHVVADTSVAKFSTILRMDDTGTSDDELEEKSARVDRNGDDDASNAGGEWYILPNLTEATYAFCIKPLWRPVGATRTGWRCPSVSRPFELGSVRGHSSTVYYTSMSVRQREVVAGLPCQRYSNQSMFFPNYHVVRDRTSDLMDRWLVRGALAQYEDLLASRPWDEMWLRHVKTFFIIDPRELSGEQTAWIAEQLKFQFRWRQAFWVLGHWISLSRGKTKGGDWGSLYRGRMNLINRFRNALAERTSLPNGITDLVWSEPAIWFASLRECHWIVSDLIETPLRQQLAELDQLEPIRSQWGPAPGRFVEGLLKEQLEMLDAQPGCWGVYSPFGGDDISKMSEIAYVGVTTSPAFHTSAYSGSASSS